MPTISYMVTKWRPLLFVLYSLANIAIVLFAQAFVFSIHVDAVSVPKLYITELQVRDAEFIELYNPTEDEINLAGWQVKYRGGGATELTLKVFTQADSIGPQELILLARNYQPINGIQTYPFSASLANESGYISVLDNNSVEVDLIGWGAAAHKKQQQAAVAPGTEQSLQRCFTGEYLVLSDPPNNGLDFVIYALTTPGSRIACVEPEQVEGCYDHAGKEVSIAEGYYRAQDGTCQQIPSCSVVISEISSQPNLNGREYIELYNQGDTVAMLELCTVRINGGVDRLMSGELQPNHYYVMSLNNGTIRNSAGVVTVLDSDMREVHYNYPESKAGQTINFILGDTIGFIGAIPTPELENVDTRLPDDVLSVGTLGTSVADCGPGKYRNPETNRCKNIEVPTSLQPCDIGQERNPATNRCRKVVANTANPALAAATNGAAINPTQFSYKIIAGVLAVALSYGVYEYRTDIANYYQSWRSKHAKGRPPG